MRKYKMKIIPFICFLFIFTLTGCSSKDSDEMDNKKVNIAIIFNESGLGDKSFNDLCYEGMLKAQENLDIEFDYTQVRNKDKYEDIYEEYANTKNYDLIIGLGEEQENALKKASKKFPNQKFTIIDSKLKMDNTSSISTNWYEQTFLNGVIAGLCISQNNKEDNNKVGIILGKNLSYLNEGAIGFEAGVKYINKDIKVIKAVVNNFSNPAKAKEIALLMYSKGAAYIQQLAGQSGFGVFAAAKESDKYVFGVDANQNSYEPDYIVSTAIRHADKIIYDEISSVVNNTWKSGVKELGLRDNVIGYDRAGSNVKVNSDIIEKIEKIKESIINKEIKIPSTYEELEKIYG